MKPQIIFSIVAVLMTGCGKPTPLDLLYSSGMPGNPAAEAAAPSGPLAELLRKHGGKTEMEIGNE